MGIYDDELKRIALENKVLYKFYNDVVKTLDSGLSSKKQVSQILYYRTMLETNLDNINGGC